MTLRLNNQQNNSANIDYADQVGGADSNITIPQGDGTIAMVGANGGLAGNISAATIFRLNADFDDNGNTITGWETPDQAGESAGVGGAVTEASGIFTFPVTGIWMVVHTARIVNADSDNTTQVVTQYTVDNGGNWNQRAICSNGSGNGVSRGTATSFAIFDVTDVGQCLVRFVTDSFSAGSRLEGNTTSNSTTALFLRLGDT